MTQEERKAKKRESDRKYREANKEKIKASHKAWRDKNREKLNEQQRERYKENPQAFKERKDRYVESHLEQVKESRTRYKKENRQKCTDYQRLKRQSDPVYRFRSSFTHLMSLYRRKKGYTGSKGTWEMVGCDFDTFLLYIQNQFEDGMTLENYGHGKGCWNIDHIVPISTAKTDEDIERLNHFTNLRPMWSIDNCKKSRKMP